jgi:hypothetical protein
VKAASLVLGLFRRGKRRRSEARNVALELVAEMRAILASCDGGGEPAAFHRFTRSRHLLPELFSKETLYAVETFYQCVDAYRDARVSMIEAFGEASTSSLGDRIRAKDHRDRSLKDVLFAGEAAIQSVSRISS